MLRQLAVVVAVLAVLAPVGVLMVMPAGPEIYFDVDPRAQVGAPVTMLGPAAQAWWQTLAVAASAAGLAAALWAGARLQRWALLLAGLGMAAAAYHMTRSHGSLQQGGAWIAAASLGLAGAHLAQIGTGRRWLAAGLAALLLPVAFDAAYYIFIDHPMTVAHFEQARDQVFAARGWQADSPQALLFERRLRSPEAVGAYGLSNVLGSVVLGLTLIASAAAVGFLVTGRRGAGAAAGTLVAAGLTAVVLTGSKGAMLTLPAAAVLLALTWWLMRRRGSGWLLALAVAGMPALAFVAVIVRGALGPPATPEGELSLLFRWHYWQAAARMLFDNDTRWLLGVGPGSFKSLYMQHKNPLNPEEVTSAHNVIVDYVTMLGVGGLAWSSLLVGWAVLAAWRLPRVRRARMGESYEHHGHWQPWRVVALLWTLAAAVIFGMQYATELPSMVAESAVAWLISGLGFVAVATWLTLAGAARWAAAGLVVAAAAVLMHNQIEMSFHHAGGSLAVWLIIGIAGAAAGGARVRRTWHRFTPAGLAVVALLMGILYARPVTQQQGFVRDARLALQAGQPLHALEYLDEAGALAPTDPYVLRYRISLRLEQAEALLHAGRQEQRDAVLSEAQRIAFHAATVSAEPASALRHAAAAALASGDLTAAGEALSQAALLAPYDLRVHLDLAEVLERQGKHDRAAAARKRALQISDWNRLDPAKQLSRAERQLVESRIADQAY